MTDAPTIDPEIKAIADEARGSFDLRARLEKRNLREGRVTLFLDEKTGEKLGEATVVERENGFGMKLEPVVKRSGVLGKIADLEDEVKAKVDAAGNDPLAADTADLEASLTALRAERDELIAILNSTALVVSLRNVPPVIREGARRNAKKDSGITSKNVPDEKEEAFNRRNNEYLLRDSIVSVEDVESGGVNTGLTLEDVQSLIELLPESEYVRLSLKMSEVVFKQVVADSVTGSSDF